MNNIFTVITIYNNNCWLLLNLCCISRLVLPSVHLCVVLFLTPQVLVKVPGVDVAQEMVKVNNFMPMKMGDKNLVMTLIRQPVSLGTPVRVRIALTARVLCMVSLQRRD